MSKTLTQIHEEVPADHYDYGISHNVLQKIWHAKRFTEVLKVIKPVKGAVLDVGCHSGTFTSKILARVGKCDVYGVDISPSAIALISKRIPGGHFQVADAAKLPFKDNFFEAVFCLEMLEHVEDPILVLSEIKRVLKKDGYGVVLVPTDNSLFKIVWSLWNFYYPVWRHAHVHSFQDGDLEKSLKTLGLEIAVCKTFILGMLKLVVFKKNFPS